jgi:hypothetical protein
MLVFYILAYIGIVLFYIILYNNGEGPVMMEKAFSPITVFLFLPFLDFIVFSNNKKLFLKSLFIAIIIILGFARFISASKGYSARIQYLNEIIKNASSPKSVRYEDNEFKKHAGISWALGVETLLYSSLKGPNHSKTVYFIKEGNKLDSSYLANPNTFLCVTFWPYWEADKLNRRYFNLPSVKYELPANYDTEPVTTP